jgi:6-phosphogluconolactonase
LYVAQRSSNSLSAYSINSLSGKLILINTIAAVDNPVYISTDKTGKFLLSAYYNANKAAVYGINADGSLKATVIKTITTGTNPHSILTDNTNQYLYIPNMTGNIIEQYSFNSTTGEFSALNPANVTPPAGTCPRHLIFHGTKNVVYVSNEVNNSVTCYRTNSLDGTLTSFQNIKTIPASFAAYSKCADIHITPDNKFLYASNRGHESIVAYAINENSDTLTTIGYYSTVVSPREFDLDPTGSFLYSAGETNGDLSYYKINKQSGQLDSISTFSVGKTPSWVLITDFVNSSTGSNSLPTIKKQSSIKSSPNPFQETTVFNYKIYNRAFVSLKIYDTSGKLIKILKEGIDSAGEHSVRWEPEITGEPLSGVYICKIATDEYCDEVRVLCLRKL